MDQAGNLYGSTGGDGADGGGTIFELSPSNGQWVATVLYSLAGTEGPLASLTMDAAGNLYGTAYKDGAHNAGMVFKLTNSNGIWTLDDLHDFTGGRDGGNPFSNVSIDSGGNLYGTAQFGGSWELPGRLRRGQGNYAIADPSRQHSISVTVVISPYRK